MSKTAYFEQNLDLNQTDHNIPNFRSYFCIMDEVASHDPLSNILERSPDKALYVQALLRFSAQTLDFSLLPLIAPPSVLYYD